MLIKDLLLDVLPKTPDEELEIDLSMFKRKKQTSILIVVYRKCQTVTSRHRFEANHDFLYHYTHNLYTTDMEVIR